MYIAPLTQKEQAWNVTPLATEKVIRGQGFGQDKPAEA